MKQYRIDFFLALAVFVAALAVRVVIAAPVFAGDTRFIIGDDDDYYNIAISLITSGTFGINGSPTAYRMPFFPLFLAFWHLLLGPQPYAPLLVMLVFGSLIPLGSYILGRYLADRSVGMIAGLLLTFDKDLIFYSRLYMTETMFCLLILASMLATWRLRVTLAWGWAVVVGLTLGCACLTRANFLPFVAVLLLWLLWLRRDRLRLALRNAATIGLIVGAIWVPWVVRNYLVFHQLIPFTTQGGYAYYGLYNDAAVLPGERYGVWIWLGVNPPQEPGKVWDEATLDGYHRDLAFQWISAHPAESVKVALMQIYYFWSNEDAGSYLRAVVVGLPTLIILAVSWRYPDMLLWLALALTMTLLALISVGQARYAFPLRPILAVSTAMALSAATRMLSRWRKRGVVTEGPA